MFQKEIGKCLIEIQHIIEFIENNTTENGDKMMSNVCLSFHVRQLSIIRNMLRYHLTVENKEKYDQWLSKRGIGE